MAAFAWPSRRMRKEVQKVLYSALVCALALAWYSPVFWMLSTSLKPNMVATSYPPRWIPNPLTLENYAAITGSVRGLNVLGAFWRSLIVATTSAVCTLLVATPAAYALARLRFPGRSLLFWSYVATLAFPPALFLVPTYLVIRALHLMDTLPAVILPGIGGAFGVFLLRQFMLGIPRELEEAAWVDGCSRMRFLLSIMLPLVRPALVTLGLMTFLSSWNSLIWPLLVLNDPAKLTLPVALARLMGAYDTFMREIGWVMAGAMLAVGPAILFFSLFHKAIIHGISLGWIGK